MKNKIKISGQKGDITFFSYKGTAFQKMSGVFTSKIKIGRMAYMPLKIIGGLHIKYNSNGLYGFGVFGGRKGKKRLMDGFWSMAEAEKALAGIAGNKRVITLKKGA